MTVSYRNRYTSYKQETDGQYAPVGSIVSVLVDDYSSGAQSPEYAYRNYLYCDGREVNIRDYPYLYKAVGNTYGGDNQTYFNLPDYRPRNSKGEPQPYDASKAPVVLICIQGIYPSWDW